MKPIRFLLLLLFVTAPATGAVVVEKSPVDRKDYRYLQLENGLKVLLVSDPGTDKAAASLDVHIGNGSDPSDWQGLAHFLEHMLFLGTEKYPEAGEYKKFIDDHGGSNNAYTSFDHTNYYFQLGADHLYPALDRFSRFFIDPTFDATYVNRERSVVHSEYQARRKDEGRRLWTATRELVNPDHPWSRFAVGSEETLRDRADKSARERLIEFYEEHYSADIMALSVVGRESLDTLEEWVRELFSEVPDRDARPQLFRDPYINRELITYRLDVVPEKAKQRVSFIFPVPSTYEQYESKPVGYIGNLVGHEGEGSLLALLKSLGWAESLSAGSGYLDPVQATFNVSIELTEPGLERIPEIGNLLFRYIDLVRDEGVASWRYDEEKQLANMAFRFAEEPAAGALARSLSSRLHRYPPTDVLRGPYMMDRFEPEVIREVLGYLRPDNVLLQVVSPDAITTDVTDYYDVDFGLSPIGDETLASWAEGKADSRLALPESNPFIPERLALNAPPMGTDPPRQIDAMKGMEVWHSPDQEFKTPRSAFYFSLQSPLAQDGVRNRVKLEMLVRLVDEQLATTSYPAYLAGLHYSLYRHARGFSVRISGYEDRQPELLAQILARLHSVEIDPEKTELVRAELKRDWRNVALDAPSDQVVHEIYRLVMDPYWSEAERLAVIDDVSTQEIETFARNLVREARLTALAHGDIRAARAEEMVAMLAEAFPDATLETDVAQVQARMLEAGPTWLRSLDVDHGDSAVAVYYQGESKSDLEWARLSLLLQLLEPGFYDDLRTTHRVGYLVYATRLDIMEAPGMLLSVQSPTHTVAEIVGLMDDFLANFATSLDSLDEAQFEKVKRGLISRILTVDRKLTNRTRRYWREIDLNKTGFDTREKRATLVESLTLDEVRAYYRQLVVESPRRLIVQTPGRRDGAAEGLLGGDGFRPTGDATAFRQIRLEHFAPYHGS